MPGDIIAATSPTPPISITAEGVQNSLLNVDVGERGRHVLERLSSRAQSLARQLAAEDFKTSAVSNEKTRRRFELHSQLSDAEFQRDHARHALEQQYGVGGFIRKKVVKDKDGKETTIEVNELAAHDLDIRRLKDEQRVLDATETESPVMPHVFEQLGQQPLNKNFSDADLSEFVAADGEGELENYERTSAAVNALTALEQATIKKPRPPAHIKSKVSSILDRLEKDGRPRINGLRRGYHVDRRGRWSTADDPDAEIEWPAKLSGAVSGHSGLTVDDTIPLLVWFFRDHIQKRLFEMVDAYGDKGTMTESQKNGALAKIRADLWKAKHAEECAIRRCRAAGIDVKRREFDFRILLSIE